MASPSRCRVCQVLVLVVLIRGHSPAATAKTHVIAFGKWTTVQWTPVAGAEKDKPLLLKVRPLLVDSRVKEFTLGSAHEVTDRLFVVQRAVRINDSLPQESGSQPHWLWQRGGWLLVARDTGHVSSINLPEFDALYSAVSWYRDYAAYCGVSDDGKKVYAMVAQISRRKPVLKKVLDGPGTSEIATADSACPAPLWQRDPGRVTFEPAPGETQTFAIRGHIVDLVTNEEDEEEASK